jgi:hypothetical protein
VTIMLYEAMFAIESLSGHIGVFDFEVKRVDA